mmetsp:Transcript_2373/g.3655  ORF Transcript_2373/g.3655 Transcript_2373/m.3655 type:complete len:205 (-) Transcript_2373:114-728(-)
MLDGNLNIAHITLSSEVQIFIQKISMTIFFGSPSSAPSSPCRVGCSSGVVASFKGVEKGLVGGERFFGDHVSNEDDEDIVGNPVRHLSEFLHLVIPTILCQIREVVLWLPCLFACFEENFINHCIDHGRKVLYDLNVFGIKKRCSHQSLLECLIIKVDTTDVFVLLIGNNTEIRNRTTSCDDGSLGGRCKGRCHRGTCQKSYKG